jgi:hypothetical protein
MPQTRFSSPTSNHCDLIDLHSINTIRSIRSVRGCTVLRGTVSHTSTIPKPVTNFSIRWSSYYQWSRYYQDAVKIDPMIIFGGNESDPHSKNLLCPLYWMSRRHIYTRIHYPDASAKRCHSPPGGHRESLVNFVVSLVSIAVIRLFIPTFVYAMFPLNRSKWVWLTSCNRIMLVSCLWRNSASAFLLSLKCHWRWRSLFDTFPTLEEKEKTR